MTLKENLICIADSVFANLTYRNSLLLIDMCLESKTRMTKSIKTKLFKIIKIYIYIYVKHHCFSNERGIKIVGLSVLF